MENEPDSIKLEWRTEKRKVADLKLFEGNPRTMSEKQAQDLINSLTKFNLVELPVVDQNNRIIAGNMRITALNKLGRENEEIEVRVPSRELTEEEAREYLLRSNKNVGEWNYSELANFDEDMLLDCGWVTQELFLLKDDLFDNISNGSLFSNLGNSDFIQVTFLFGKQFAPIIQQMLKINGKKYYENILLKEFQKDATLR